ncbi:serine hydrolase domain-containing protein [Sporosarcina ureae]|uniref:serine hydrolase domain-containing protein n=1 Tax=Sporosarcina ureae TaxID=1571 RepID=UPI0009DC4C00|nr:serine hydrolase domain-containing protein [Sporosarcina ureae]ARF17381.1 serine hydrolase [Sporosarcina ureae]
MKGVMLKILLLLTAVTMLMIPIVGNGVIKAREINDVTETEEKQIEKVVMEKMRKGKIPGLYITIVKDDKTVYQKGFGFSNLKEERPVTSQSLFELASTSKAFTALAILNLVESGQIELNDNVTTYIPWLKVLYKGKEMPITIEQTLHQTTGIPASTINMIPISNEDRALEETVRTLNGIELDSEPGKMFQYATINYDILGLIIEQVTGGTYEYYMKENILKPMELNNTYLFLNEEINNQMTTGYKIGFLKPRRYEAPIYRGNKPAGYIISSGKDMAKWLKIQMGTMNEMDFDKEIIKKSHIAERAVDIVGNEVFYAGGWFLEPNEQVTHDGMNPNYSTYVTFNNKEKIGVAVLGNLSSNQVQNIGVEIKEILQGNIVSSDKEDSNQYLDQLALSTILVLSILILVALILIIKVLLKVYRKQLHVKRNGIKSLIKLTVSLLCVLGLSLIIYLIPSILLNGYSWEAVFIWSPQSVQVALYMIYSIIWLIYILFILKVYFKEVKTSQHDNKVDAT